MADFVGPLPAPQIIQPDVKSPEEDNSFVGPLPRVEDPFVGPRQPTPEPLPDPGAVLDPFIPTEPTQPSPDDFVGPPAPSPRRRSRGKPGTPRIERVDPGIEITQPRKVSVEPQAIEEQVRPVFTKVIPRQPSVQELRQQDLSSQARKVFPEQKPISTLTKGEDTPRGRAIRDIELGKLEFEEASKLQSDVKTQKELLLDIEKGLTGLGTVVKGELGITGLTLIDAVLNPVATVKGFVELPIQAFINPTATTRTIFDVSRPGALGELGTAFVLGEFIKLGPKGITKVKEFRANVKRQQTVTIEGSKGLGDFTEVSGFQVLDPALLELGVDPVLSGKGIISRGETTFQTQLEPKPFDPISTLTLEKQFQPRAVVDPFFKAQIDPTQTILGVKKTVRITESGQTIVDIIEGKPTPLEKAPIKQELKGFQREVEDFGRITKTPEELALERTKALNDVPTDVSKLIFADPTGFGLESILQIQKGVTKLKSPLREAIFTPEKFTEVFTKAVKGGKPLPLISLDPDTDLIIDTLPSLSEAVSPSISQLPKQDITVIPSISTLPIQEASIIPDVMIESLSDTRTRQQQSQAQEQAQLQEQELQQITVSQLVEPLTTRQVSRQPPISELISKPLLLSDDDEKKRKKKEDLLTLTIGKPGLETFTITKGLKEKTALSLAKEVLDNTPAVTAGLIEERTGKRLLAAKFIKPLGEQFRVGKSSPFDIVEKTKFRISSPGEKEGITFKGLLARKRSRSFF